MNCAVDFGFMSTSRNPSTPLHYMGAGESESTPKQVYVRTVHLQAAASVLYSTTPSVFYSTMRSVA